MVVLPTGSEKYARSHMAGAPIPEKPAGARVRQQRAAVDEARPRGCFRCPLFSILLRRVA